jgi:ER-bound oxygenase mpaB/B'/Rubber oxygenase, catalytic domain
VNIGPGVACGSRVDKMRPCRSRTNIVMEPGGLGPHGYGIRTVQKVRLMHAAVRHGLHHGKNLKWDELFSGVPINQEDLAGTLLTFSFLSIDGLRKLGANISSEAAKAYFDTWCGIGRVLGVRPEMIPDSLEAAAELKEIISRRQFAPSDEGREMTQALIEMLEKNSPPLLESIPTGLMRLFIQAEIADYLGIPTGRLQDEMASMVVGFAKFVDHDLEESHWRAVFFRHHILSLIEGMIELEAGNRQDFFRLPTNLHSN